MALGRTDSDLDDVWSEEPTGDNAELTEFDFNPPRKKEPPKRRPPLISDLEAPVLGLPPVVSPPQPTKSATLQIGSVLVGASTTSLLDDARADRSEASEKDARTMMADAESAAIARVVSRSLSNSDGPSVSIPAVLERNEVNKVLMGQLEEEPLPEIAAPVVEPTSEPEAEAPLELAFDPHLVPKPVFPQRSVVMPPSSRSVPIKGIVLVLLAIVAAAFVVRWVAFG